MQSSGSPQRSVVLLTGATGMVGSQVLARLLSHGVPVAVLTRDSTARSSIHGQAGNVSAEQRIDDLLKRFEARRGIALDRPTILRGDLNLADLGLDQRSRHFVAQRVGSVIHSAASLSFRPASESTNGEPYRTNVDGTANLIEHCHRSGIQDFHYVSTAYVCGLRSGRVLESECDCGQSFSNDYERSKCQAEALVRSATGWPQATIYRPSIVIDSTGLSPVTEDRTVYSAYGLFETLASKFGLPKPGEWFHNLGFSGNERKNLVEAEWVAEAICRIFLDQSLHGSTYHLTDPVGTSIADLEAAFFQVASPTISPAPASAALHPASQRSKRGMLDAIAAPFVDTFRPYFRDDPQFDRAQIDRAIAKLDLPDHHAVTSVTLAAMIRSRHQAAGIADDGSAESDPIVVVGRAVRLPGGVDNVEALESLLFDGRSALQPVPPSRFDHELYYDSRRGQVGKSYTKFGGCVDSQPLDPRIEMAIAKLGTFDLTHRQFAQVALKAWSDAGLASDPSVHPQHQKLAARCGVFVGHSGGTDQGGPLAMATLADAASESMTEAQSYEQLPAEAKQDLCEAVARRLRQGRPVRTDDSVHLDAYSAAALVARLLSLGGIREVIDAACASSLLGLEHAVSAIRNGRIDAAIVGGATYNNVDNLILFSQSQACSESISSPFDQHASGLISSEGYVAVTITKRSIAERLKLPIHAVIRAVGVASDGRGKSLWAPRTEGQQLAIRRGYSDSQPLAIDYLEAHATSTQVGDATELVSLTQVSGNQHHLLVGSVKSNLGHTLEAAGLVGLVKLLIAMQRGAIPPTINFTEPTSEFDWSANRITVVSQTTPWPTPSDNNRSVRRGAVNAFGIGGLNGHAVIESYDGAQTRHRHYVAPPRDPSQPSEPIAIVGRGVVLPGAFHVDALSRLLDSDQSALGEPPPGRWLGGNGFGTGPFTVPTRRGGYIDGYRFNGQPYRIPPKQTELANPLQMMLLDAVAQAAQEADGGTWQADRVRTSVVIGTIFGGEFSNHLQVGLRLPEICKHVRNVLQSRSVSPEVIENLVAEFHARMLRRHSAILDETGGFTASTLASRIAKTFDLMGGACAVDADDASGGLAMMIASDQLRSGKIDAVVCGVAQRSLDLLGFKDLELRNRLAIESADKPIPPDCSKVFPGEGVAVVILRRLSDAVRSGQKILGIIDQIDSGHSSNVDRDKQAAMADDRLNQQIVEKIGYIAGAHSLVRLIAQTFRFQHDSAAQQPIPSFARDGFTITVHTRNPMIKVSQPVSTNTAEATVLQSFTPASISANSVTQQRIVIVQGSDEHDFLKQLQAASQSPENAFIQGCAADSVPPIDPNQRHVAGIIVDSSNSLVAGLETLERAWKRGVRTGVFDQQLAILWDTGKGVGRVAWAFPGQGSQYSAIPQVVAEDPSASEFIHQFDQHLAGMNLAGLAGDLGDARRRLGQDIWWTQLWILGVSWTLADSLRRSGLRPDLVFGHSFGECGAALQAGVMTIDQAITFAKLRSEAVVMTSQDRGKLLSVRATPAEVQAVVSSLDIRVYLTHHNSPTQTVIAGDPDSIEDARRALADQSIASVVIPVPAAFHSPAMTSARQVLINGFQSERLKPPHVGFYSTIRGKYLAEPDSIQSCLIDQLTQPLLYDAAVRRLVKDGCRLLVEVGPGDVLTRLHREIVSDNAICLSLDHGKHRHTDRLRFIALAQQLVTGIGAPQPPQSTVPTLSRPMDRVAPNPSLNPLESQIETSVEVVDVTRRRRATPSPTPASTIAAPVANNGVALAAGPITPPAVDQELVKRYLVDLVVELTGYQRDVIDFDADLESELGIDSIKKAQIIGEVAEWAALQLDLKQMRLATFQSLRDIAKLVEPGPGAHVATNAGASVSVESRAGAISAVHSAMQPSPPSPLPQPWNDDSTFSEASPKRASRETSVDPVTALMVDFIIDQTGYSPDVIDLEADLEAELGIDSIKKAQLLGELASHFELEQVDLRKLRLADFPTLGSIRQFIYEHDTKRIVAPQLAFSHNQTDAAVDSKKKSDDEILDRLTVPNLASRDKLPIPAKGTCRFGLTMVAAPRRVGTPQSPSWKSGALVIGANPIADALTDRLRRFGLAVRCIATSDASSIDATLSAIWKTCETPHLFITTPHDAAALGTLATGDWQQRRRAALSVPFRVCQLWMQRMIDSGQMDQASLVAVVNAGGDFGFSGSRVITAESGGIAGLTKAMLIEAWMRGYRRTPMKVIDIAPEVSVAAAIDGICAELAVPSHDEEVAVDGLDRRVVRPCYLPLETKTASTPSPPSRGGNWVISGGGRGITALTALALAETYDLTLHLLGTAPCPELSESTRQRAESDRAALRREVMAAAQQVGQNPIDAWRDLEKAIEIDATLRQCKHHNIRATYHSVDVANAQSVAMVLQTIRDSDGPIRGVIHGAGAGQDARFDRKRLEKVEKCIRAKVDGAIALAEATRNDPLEWFVGFGSISGRFGANGHTDYSLANDMLAKLVGRLGQERPATRCVTFHWHAWGDIGMATKPEAKLALEMIGMEFMPAAEGLQHFLNEFAAGGDMPEVLITDRNYIRKFFPGFGESTPTATALPLLAPSGHDRMPTATATERAWVVTLDPQRDRFLSEHLVGGKPTLPFVVALEMMAEAARHDLGDRATGVIRDAEAIQALKFASDDAMAVEVVAGNAVDMRSFQPATYSIRADLRRRDGRVVEPSREHFRAVFDPDHDKPMPSCIETCCARESLGDGRDWMADPRFADVCYLERDAPVFHGESLRTLAKIYIDPSGEAIGLLTAPSPIEMGGQNRPVDGWCIPCAVMDGMLYASAMLGHSVSGRASLPVRFAAIHLGRLPDPGEPLRAMLRATNSDSSGMTLDADLIGLNGDRLIAIRQYRIHWIG